MSPVGDLVEGLRATCPNLRFLLTSRRPLGLSGEDVIVVPPLSLPDEATVATPETITHHEAVNLFVDRATSARSDFRLTPANAPAVVGLCRDLDGVPLAIELAAARIRALSPQEIRDSLAERVEVLNLGYRDADERHQSLRACVDWSFQLCSELEQRFWARSSVFNGGYDLAAAAAVCGADDLPAGEILDLVSALVDQSILSPMMPPTATRGIACSARSGSSGSSGRRRPASCTGCRSGTQPGARSWRPASTTTLADRASGTGCGVLRLGAREPAGRARVLRR